MLDGLYFSNRLLQLEYYIFTSRSEQLFQILNKKGQILFQQGLVYM